MIVNYYQPSKIDEAIKLLSSKPDVIPMGGGTHINAFISDPVSVVSLQDLGLDDISLAGNKLIIGATAKLQSLINFSSTPESLKKALEIEANHTLRNMSTCAGRLVTSDGRSPYALILLSLDAVVNLFPTCESIAVGDLLALRKKILKGQLIKSIEISTAPRSLFDYVSRSPRDVPLLSIGFSRWKSGRTRISLGGFGANPILAVDGSDDDLEFPIRSALENSEDHRASSEYRIEASIILAKRLMSKIQN